MTDPTPPGDPEPVLPEPVRVRVVALAADALGAIEPDRLPAALRRVAGFTPQRRARLAGTQIALALATDDDFRERVAGRVRARLPAAGQVAAGVDAPAADPVEVAALAYLLRPDGWAGTVARAGERAVDEEVARATEVARAEAERLRRLVDEAEAGVREVRARVREQQVRLRDENTTLRQRLAEARQRAREARSAAEAGVEQATAATDAARAGAAAAEAETRRLRGRVSELETQLAALRREDRGGRDAATTRARLLMDTLTDAVQGLRRELALPAVDVLPADLVAALDPTSAVLRAGSDRALRADDPAMLGQLLGLPRVHLVVDGYNVTKTGYPTLALDQQRARLLRDLAPVAARTGAEVTVVFDGADLAAPPPVAGPRGVRVRFSPPGVTADEVIARLVEAEPRGRPLVVVSTDREVAAAAVDAGARAVPSVALVALLAS